MTLTSKVKQRVSDLLHGRGRARRGTEQDAGHDDHQALRRPVGGDKGKSSTTTGSGSSGEFVGRVSGEDPEEDTR